jgi:hypothetical protein
MAISDTSAYVLSIAQSEDPVNARYLAVGTGLEISDAGPGNALTITPTRMLGSIEAIETIGYLARLNDDTAAVRQFQNDGSISISPIDGSGDPIFGVVPDTTLQKTNFYMNGVLQGTRQSINFIAGTNIGLFPVDNGSENRMDITITSGNPSDDPTALITNDIIARTQNAAANLWANDTLPSITIGGSGTTAMTIGQGALGPVKFGNGAYEVQIGLDATEGINIGQGILTGEIDIGAYNASNINIGNDATGSINIGTNCTANIDIGHAAAGNVIIADYATGYLSMGYIATGAIDIGNTCSALISLGDNSTGGIHIGTGTSTGAVTIGNISQPTTFPGNVVINGTLTANLPYYFNQFYGSTTANVLITLLGTPINILPAGSVISEDFSIDLVTGIATCIAASTYAYKFDYNVAVYQPQDSTTRSVFVFLGVNGNTQNNSVGPTAIGLTANAVGSFNPGNASIGGVYFINPGDTVQLYAYSNIGSPNGSCGFALNASIIRLG